MQSLIYSLDSLPPRISEDLANLTHTLDSGNVPTISDAFLPESNMILLQPGSKKASRGSVADKPSQSRTTMSTADLKQAISTFSSQKAAI